MCACIPLQKSPDAADVVHAVNDIIPILGCDRQNFCLLLSDAAAYMVAAATTLHILYPRLFHITCVAHLLHNCAMKVRNNFPNVDHVIAVVKAACVKNKERQSLFHAIGRPPTPIVTRWASWLEAAFYYADHLPEVRTIVGKLEGNGLLVKRCKEALANKDLSQNLLQITSCYSHLATTVKKFESSSFTIAEAFQLLQGMTFGDDPCDVKKYLEKRLLKNEMNSIMALTRSEISPTLYGMLQHCQPSSSAVERSFSKLNKLLAKDRIFKIENVRKYIILYVNNTVTEC